MMDRALLIAACGLTWLGQPSGHLTAAAVQTQEGSFAHDTYVDPVARLLHAGAQAKWLTLDESVVRYTALIEQRIAASIRTPLKDRVLYHNETAVRAFWDQDYDAVIQVLGTRSRYPGRETAVREGDLEWLEDLPFDEPFEPGGDRLFWGTNTDDAVFEPDGDGFWLAHPLSQGADSLYRFQSGDTLTLTLPRGRHLTLIQLNVLPREADVRRISGALWIEPESGALVRALYRLSREFDVIRDIPDVRQADEDNEFRFVPGIFKPWTFNLTMIAVDYALWDFEVWLPRSLRMEGEAGAGILKVPVSMDVSYRMEDVTLASDQAEEPAASGLAIDTTAERKPGVAVDADEDLRHVHFENRADAMAFIAELLGDDDGTAYELMADSATPQRDRSTFLVVPTDRSVVESSPHLPEPIWSDAPGFLTEDEVADYMARLAKLPAPPIQVSPWNFHWGWARPDFIRYNRVEGPAVGGALTTQLNNRHSFNLSGFFGLADLRPKARIDFKRSTVLRQWSAGLFHEVRATDPDGRYLDLGNSLNALFFGRDEGEYYRATGADATWGSPQAARASFHLRAYAERHAAVGLKSNFALFRMLGGNWTFRPNIRADAVDEAGIELRLAPWLGSNPASAQLGVEIRGRGAMWRPIHAANPSTSHYQQASLTVRALLPAHASARGRWWIGAEAGGGHTWGLAPAQRSWFMGSGRTLRGYSASVLSGPSFLRGRLELSHSFDIGSSVILFGDAAWAGRQRAFDGSEMLYGVGIGGSVLDGLIRLDVSHGLTGPQRRLRIDLHLDAIL